jgi:hypothetical protein
MNAKMTFTHRIRTLALALVFIALIGFSSQPAWAQRGGGGGRQGSKQRGSRSAVKSGDWGKRPANRNYKTSRFGNTIEAPPVRPQANSNEELRRRAKVKFDPRELQVDKIKWEPSELDAAANESGMRPRADYCGDGVVASEGWDEVPEDILFPRARKNMSSARIGTSNSPKWTASHADNDTGGLQPHGTGLLDHVPATVLLPALQSSEIPGDHDADLYTRIGIHGRKDMERVPGAGNEAIIGLGHIWPQSSRSIRNQPRSLTGQDQETGEIITWGQSGIGVAFDSQTRPHADGIK